MSAAPSVIRAASASSSQLAPLGLGRAARGDRGVALVRAPDGDRRAGRARVISGDSDAAVSFQSGLASATAIASSADGRHLGGASARRDREHRQQVEAARERGVAGRDVERARAPPRRPARPRATPAGAWRPRLSARRATRSSSNHTRVPSCVSTPQRLAMRSTRNRPKPPSAPRGSGLPGSKPAPPSRTSTRIARAPIRTASSTGCGRAGHVAHGVGHELGDEQPQRAALALARARGAASSRARGARARASRARARSAP